MHRPYSLRVCLICDSSTRPWADAVRAFAEICLYRVELVELAWRANIREYFARPDNADITVFALHGGSEDGASVNFAECIDESIADAARNRVSARFWDQEEPSTNKRGIAINMGCATTGQNLGALAMRMGFSTYIANPSETLFFGSAICWVNEFLSRLVKGSFENQETIGTLDLDANQVSTALKAANREISTSDTVFISVHPR
jgi:hypothetical protein